MCVPSPNVEKPRARGFKERITIYGFGREKYAILKEAEAWLCLSDQDKIRNAGEDDAITVNRTDGHATVTVKKAAVA